MYRDNKIETMLSEIAANVERMEQELKEEYKKLIRISSDFDDIAAEFILLERKALPPEVKEEETTTIVDRLCERLDMTYGQERDTFFILEAAMAVMEETSSAAVMSRN